MDSRIQNLLFQVSRIAFALAFVVLIMTMMQQLRFHDHGDWKAQQQFLSLIQWHAIALIVCALVSVVSGLLVVMQRRLVLLWVLPQAFILLWLARGLF